MIFFFFNIERWADIQGYEGLYQISDMGRVRSLEHIIIMSNGAPRLIKDRILKPHQGGTNKYFLTYLHKDCQVKNCLIHRLVASHFLGAISDGKEVNHKNGNVQDNRLENLEIVTHQENIDHSLANHLFKAFGEKHYAALITNKQAEEIRLIYKRGGITQKQLGKLYGLKQSGVFKIVHNLTYTR